MDTTTKRGEDKWKQKETRELKTRLKALIVFIEPQVRRARASDAAQIAHLYQTSFPEHIMVHRGLLNNPDFITGRISNPDEVWMVAEKGGDIVGVAALAIAPPIGLGEIERVCVANEFRGNGVAYSVCEALVEEAKARELGFVEAFARGDQPAMQKTFDKLGFLVYGVAPRFEVMHGDKVVREQFVHMGLELKPETIDESHMSLIDKAKKLYQEIQNN